MVITRRLRNALVRRQVGDRHPDEIVGTAEQPAELDDFLGFDQHPLDVLDGVRILRLQGDVEQDLDSSTDSGGVDHRPVAPDDAVGLEPLDSPQARPGGEPDTVGELDVRQPAITLQLGDNCAIYPVHR